jgi:hypothetical protein
LSFAQVAALRRVVSRQIARIESALCSYGGGGGGGGIGCGRLNFLEVMDRGTQRWDMLLVRDDGTRVGMVEDDSERHAAEEEEEAQEDAAADEEEEAAAADDDAADEEEEAAADDAAAAVDYALLERVMRDGPWVEVMRAALGGTDAYTCQAGAIVSRPGARCGKWHTDGGHPKYNIFEEGESGTPLAVCVFIPLVDLDLPQQSAASATKQAGSSSKVAVAAAAAAAAAEVMHGRGCTAFWPGSHRHPEASSLGSVAAQAGACVSGAPMRAGDALGYDYRTVHCATPNDAAGLGAGGERPVLQLTYSKPGYSPSEGNYGSERLF